MKILLLVNFIFLSFFATCSSENLKMPVEIPKEADKTALPKDLPDNLEIGFNAGYGMSPAYKKIVIKSGELTLDAKDFIPEKKTFETTKQTAKVSRQEFARLYQVFVENAFDTIKNDERQSITYDAPGEGIYIRVSEQLTYQKSYGDNEPLSGGNLKRYQTVRKAIFDLVTRYTSGEQDDFSAENQQIFKYDAQELAHYVKDAAPAALGDEDFPVIKDLLQKAVDDYNERQSSGAQKINSLSSYKRQLIPYLNARGEKEVWLNLFCSNNGVNWRKVIVMVDDGGSCYFELKINLVNRQVISFNVNGAI